MWGWYTVLDAIAEGNRFGDPALSKMHGALTSNFYEAMIWVANQRHKQADTAKND